MHDPNKSDIVNRRRANTSNPYTSNCSHWVCSRW